MRIAVPCCTGLALLCLTACSSGPAAPEKGTPGFYWSAAKESFAAGDSLKTNDNLDHLLKGANEYKSQAQPWALVVTSGLAHGYMEAANAFEQGGHSNKGSVGAFRRQTSDSRRAARGLALQFSERLQDFTASNKDEPVRLAFPFPNGTTAPVPLLNKASNGIIATGDEIEDGLKAVLRRGVVIEASRAAGAGDDATKARQMFASGEAKVPRAEFLVAMASALHDQAQVFGPTQLDEPEKVRMMCQQALDSIKGVPESKQSKELVEKISKTTKSLKPRS